METRKTQVGDKVRLVTCDELGVGTVVEANIDHVNFGAGYVRVSWDTYHPQHLFLHNERDLVRVNET